MSARIEIHQRGTCYDDTVTIENDNGEISYSAQRVSGNNRSGLLTLTEQQGILALFKEIKEIDPDEIEDWLLQMMANIDLVPIRACAANVIYVNSDICWLLIHDYFEQQKLVNA